MEPILVYGFPLGSSMGLVAALEWLGMPYRLCRVDMLDDMRQPSYARLNPRHETPVFVTEGGTVLTETMAIAAWLEARDTERRISFAPLSPEADRMHRLMGFTNSSFTGSFSALWAALEMTDPDPHLRDALRRWGRTAVIKRHDQLEELIEDTPFLLGDRPTLADAMLAGVSRWLEFHAVAELARWPKLATWRSRIEVEPAIVFATEIENGQASTGSGAFQGHTPLAEAVGRFGASPR
ncbi:MAG: glutathione S-transferase family protein [Mesorhizobium sp.]|nr:glutathione S-transferase family protein [Mesorhizobium sp.]MBN9242590.1 glutathione S-transferase family protein [Mesorhizobium sp.]